MSSPEIADVCVVVEGTYPYVAGGVSSWVHDLIRGLPELRFFVLNVGSQAGAHVEPRYVLPDNVVGLQQIFCQAPTRPGGAPDRASLERELRRLASSSASAAGGGARVLRGLARLHLEDAVDDELLADLTAGDLTVGQLLHGPDAFQLLTALAQQVAPGASFLDLFWHFRAIHVPLLRLLRSEPVRARSYHALSTGYAGLVAAAHSFRTGRPLMVTEHGIYARERDMELARAEWIRDRVPEGVDDGMCDAAPSPLRRLWSRFFRGLSRVAYHRAVRLVTLSGVNRQKQVTDGAPESKIDIVPNGVELARAEPALAPVAADDAATGTPAMVTAGDGGPAPLRVGFVGRVVPIKDVITFVKACDLALGEVALDVQIIGPMDEDAVYAARCRSLTATLGRTDAIRFVGPLPPAQIYPRIDVVVLTSFSEGQPLVILEAYAAGRPAVATDVGACRELIEGRTAADRALGPSGIVTRVGCPRDTASALVRLARDPALRLGMGAAGRERVSRYYQRSDMLARYRSFYAGLTLEPERAGTIDTVRTLPTLAPVSLQT